MLPDALETSLAEVPTVLLGDVLLPNLKKSWVRWTEKSRIKQRSICGGKGLKVPIFAY